MIVLLILAGVTISQLTGSDNVMQKGQEAKERTDIGAIRDEVGLVLVNHKLSDATLEQDLKSQFGESAVTKSTKANDIYYVEKNGYTFTVYDDGEVVEGTVKVWDGSSTQEPTEKDDTNKEIHIYTCEELKWLQTTVNAGTTFEGYTIYLENDLDLGARESNGTWNTTANSAVQWTPIGSSSSILLKATFEGQNHTIRGVYVNHNGEFAGIFGNSYSINDLTVKNSYIQTTENYAGGIVGSVRSGEITNCHNINTYVNETERVGGIVGIIWENVNVSNCTNSGSINGKGQIAGGIVGYAYASSQISGCINTGSVNGVNYVGGVIGYNYGSSVQVNGCTNTGSVNGTGNYVGGVIGYNYTSKQVSGCTNNGSVNGAGKYVGGIIGFGNDSSQVSSCTNNGNVHGIGEVIGGIIGNANKSNQISGCTNSGNVDGNRLVGGIVGSANNDIQISGCTNSGIIDGNVDQIGGIVGHTNSNARISSCTNNGSINGAGERVGGIIGLANADSQVSSCTNSGSVYGKRLVGGIIGLGGKIISDCTNTGNVTGTADKVAGIVGDRIDGDGQDISYCFNSGNINGNGNYVGGISGWLGDAGCNDKLSYCYNKGSVVNNASSTKTGAIVGYVAKDVTITSCYYSDTITMDGIGELEAGGTSTKDELLENTTPTGETINSLQEFKDKLQDLESAKASAQNP